MSLTLSVGDLTIHRIIEQETPFLPALEMLPGLTPDLLAENRAWMQEAAALDAQDVLILCFQSYVVKTPHHTILVDSCIGNDKPRPRPKWNMKTDDTYIRALTAAGISAGAIDFVMCTHLHPDHVGWNTRLENGRWVPTFPNARYVFARNEFDYWTEQHAKTPVPCRPLATACSPWSKPGGPTSCATTTRSAIMRASCRRRATRRDMSRSHSGAAGTTRSSAAT
jgi:Metallo-beta-lactamase superfamily